MPDFLFLVAKQRDGIVFEDKHKNIPKKEP